MRMAQCTLREGGTRVLTVNMKVLRSLQQSTTPSSRMVVKDININNISPH